MYFMNCKTDLLYLQNIIIIILADFVSRTTILSHYVATSKKLNFYEFKFRRLLTIPQQQNESMFYLAFRGIRGTLH